MDLPAQMKAITFNDRHKVGVSEVNCPTPKAGEILVRTAFVGICGTDLHLFQGESFFLDEGYLKYPFIFGHEYTGTVVAVGDGVSMPLGTRIVGHCMVPCQKCENCQRGKRQLCRSLREVGLRYLQGAAAEFVCVPAYAVTVLPDDLSFKLATLTEPTVTAYHACERANIGKNDRVAVVGTGTLGLLSLLLAKMTAKYVDVIGVADSELEFAVELGARRALRPDEVEDNSYDVVVEASGVRSALKQSIRISDLGGRIALVGLPSGPSLDVDQTAIAIKDLTIHGILHGIDYYGSTVELLAAGTFDPSPLIADVKGPGFAGEMLESMTSAGRRAPKFYVEFAGEH